MANDNWQKAREVFVQAIKLDSSERPSFLDEVCAGDAETRREVESLLSSYEGAGSFLEKPAISDAPDLTETKQPQILNGTNFGHYQIIRQIGIGGMSEVYLAQDKKLDRKVAIKILNEKFAKHESNLPRFTQEAKSASALNHPNILVIHEIGESDKAHYIVSEYIEGETLREVFKQNSLSLAKVLDIAIQIAGALAAAHNVQIIHRDIKPENVIVRPDGFVKILDFGLAKLIGQNHLFPQDLMGEPNKTAKGIILGTVNYMSPEQAKGESVDERTDIFSFGVMLYEMLTGRNPFAGDSVSESFANLIKSAPLPLADFAPNVPDELQRVVTKMLQKSKDERYQSMQDLLTDLKNLQKTTVNLPEEKSLPNAENETERLDLNTGGMNLKTANYRFFERIKPYQTALVVLLAALVCAIIYFAVQAGGGKPIESVAVLPFINENKNPEVEYLSDGITDALISSLSHIPKINIKGRSSVFFYKGKEYSPNKIGKELNVQAVLIGRIVQYGDDLTLYLTLEDVQTGNVIWGEQYNKKIQNLVALRTEIARDVTDKLQVKLSGADERKLTKSYTANDDAYRLYLQGRYHWNKRTAEDLQKALDYFQQAIALDPNYALAYTGIADTYALLSNYGDAPSPRQTKPKAKEAALKALSLDDQLSEAHAALGLILTEFDYNFTEAEIHYKRAIELNPNYANVRQFYGELLTHLGRFAEADAQFQKALEIDPLSPVINRTYAGILYQARRYDDSLNQLRKTLELNANFAAAYATLSVVHNLKGEYAEGNEAYAKFQELSDLPERAALLRKSFAQGGRKAVLQTLTKEPHPAYLTSYIAATFYAELGEKDRAFKDLNESFEKREYQMVLLEVDPRLDVLRDDPRFNELIARMNFPQ